MAINVFPFDAVSGAPTYTGEMLRQTLGGLVVKGSSRPIGAASGVFPGALTSGLVTLTGTSPVVYSVNPLCAVLDLETSATAGPYLVAISTAQTGNLNAANATNPRYDLLSLTLSDPAESDGSVTPGVAVTYSVGTAAPSPSLPATPARSLALAAIYVPASGTGAPSATWGAPAAVASGGVLPCVNSTAYPLSPTLNQMIIDQSTSALLTWNGAGWVGTSRPSGRLYYNGAGAAVANASVTQVTGMTTDYLVGGVTVSSDSLIVPVAGRYRVSAGISLNGTSNAMPGAGSYVCLAMKNGSEIREWGYAQDSARNFPIASGSDVFSFAVGDAVAVAIYQNSGSGLFTRGSAKPQQACYIGIEQVA